MAPVTPILRGALVTLRVPFSVVTPVKYALTSSPSFSIFQEVTVLSLLPAFVWLPEASASSVRPSGRFSAVTPLAFSSVPSYAFSADSAVSTIAVPFSVTSRRPVCVSDIT